MKKLLAISVLSLAMAGGAFAQTTSSTEPQSDQVSASDGWSGPIADAFFEDDSMATLRSEADIRTNWAALTVEQQTAVRDICNQGAPGGGGGMELTEAQQQACNYVGEM